MEKASPVEMRKALVVVDNFKKAGVLFVPMPVMDDADHVELVAKSNSRLNALLRMAEAI